jgi:hypothetical protein
MNFSALLMDCVGHRVVWVHLENAIQFSQQGSGAGLAGIFNRFPQHSVWSSQLDDLLRKRLDPHFLRFLDARYQDRLLALLFGCNISGGEHHRNHNATNQRWPKP